MDSPVTGRFSASLTIESDGLGGVNVTIRPLEASLALTVQPAVILMTAWREGDGVVRARLEHAGSGTTSYLQGNDSLSALGRAIGLGVADKSRR